MPRGARLDAPGTLHHVVIRGIEPRNIVPDDTDREQFARRLGDTALVTGTAVYAWHCSIATPISLAEAVQLGVSTFGVDRIIDRAKRRKST